VLRNYCTVIVDFYTNIVVINYVAVAFEIKANYKHNK
jgi:hypothetical protein